MKLAAWTDFRMGRQLKPTENGGRGAGKGVALEITLKYPR